MAPQYLEANLKLGECSEDSSPNKSYLSETKSPSFNANVFRGQLHKKQASFS